MTRTVGPVVEDQLAADRPRWRVPAAAVGLVAVLGWAVVVGSGTGAPPSGLREAGLLVEWGAPVVALVGRIAAIGTVGTLLFAADDHLTAVTTLAVHVVAASLWVGGLGAVLRYGRGLPVIAERFSAVALWCFGATAVSGVLAAGFVLGGTGAVVATLGTGYGALLLAKALGLTVVGVLGWLHRRRTLPQLQAGRPGAFRQLAAVEVAVLLATVALAVALAASPPPVAAAVPSAAAPPAVADPMAGHDHGELSVGILVDATRFHVAGPVAAGSRVTVHNSTDQPVTITADDGSFDVDVPGRTLLTFPAPDQPGQYRFTSRHSPTYTDVLVVE